MPGDEGLHAMVNRIQRKGLPTSHPLVLMRSSMARLLQQLKRNSIQKEEEVSDALGAARSCHRLAVRRHTSALICPTCGSGAPCGFEFWL
jgi:hypothetical protein